MKCPQGCSVVQEVSILADISTCPKCSHLYRWGEQSKESHFLYVLLQQAIPVYGRQHETLPLGLALKL
jgi:hypothetical protein